MRRVEQATFLAIREGARVLEADSYGEKVLCLTNGNMLKLFRRKRFFSSSLWAPYAQRFANGANHLHQRGIPAPVVIDVFRVCTMKRDCVLYAPVPGKTLRDEFRINPSPHNIDVVRADIASFVRHLFDRGIYFRSLHLGNIVRTPEGTFGLIDIADLRVLPLPLPHALRVRNANRMLRISEPGEDAWIDVAVMLERNAPKAVAEPAE